MPARLHVTWPDVGGCGWCPSLSCWCTLLGPQRCLRLTHLNPNRALPTLPPPHSFLRQLPPEQGVRLEFWRSSRSLFGTARMHTSLKAIEQQGRGTMVLPLRFEALRDDFNATAGAMLAAVAGCVPGLDAGTLLEQAQECNPGAWSAEQQAANAAHVTAGQGGPQLRSRLQAALWEDGAIQRRLCQLTAALDYPLPPQCSSGSSSSSSSTTAVQTE